MTGTPRTLIIGSLLWAGPLLLLAGFLQHRLWQQLPLQRTGEGALMAFAALAAAWGLHRLLRRSLATTLAVLWCLGLVLFSGVIPTLATLVLLAAALALGTALIPRESAGLQASLGLVVLASAIGWLLPLPVHHGLAYLALAVALVVWRRRPLVQSLRALANDWSFAVAASPRAAAFAVLVLGVASTGAWLPTMQYDDLVYHLRLPWQLQLEGEYLLDPTAQVWALAPWASDVVHAFAQLIAGAEARGPVNLMWLLLAAGALWRLGGALAASATARWLVVALMGSIPLTTTLLGAMHTELPTTALLGWLVALIVERRALDWSGWLAVVVLAAGLGALKLTAAMLGGLLLVVALVRFRWPSPGRILILLAVFVLIAAPSYAYALAVSGNPFLPLFNGWFHSPFFQDANLLDARWATGFGPTLLWDMTFRTREYLESYAGAGGFSLLVLVGAVLVGVVRPGARLALLLSLALLVVPLLALQYLRYAFPGLVIASAVAGLVALRLRPQLGAGLLVGLCLLNLAFQANGHWMLANGAVRMSVGKLGADRPLLETFVPERVLMRQLRKAGEPAGNVLFLDRSNPYFAEAGSRGRAAVWYDPAFEQAALRADGVADGSAWVALLREQGASDVIVRTASSTPAVRRKALERAGAKRLSAVGGAEWWRLPPPAEDGP